MPTRQPTPGPSNISAPVDVLQPHNAKKRAVSEVPPEDEQPQPKKHRKDLELSSIDKQAVDNPSNLKDSKKKRKKKKKKAPLTIPEIILQSQARPKEPIPLSLAFSATLSESSVSPPVTASEPVRKVGLSGRVGSVAVVQDDKKQALSSVDKGKGRAVAENLDSLILQPNGSASITGSSQDPDSMTVAQAKIAELTAQLESQKKLLSRYEDNLSHLQQSLTCEICLDLLYKPFALSPCGHVACYMCLLRWFTSVQGDGNANINPVTEPDDATRLLNSQPAVRGVFLRNRKTCPLCRAAIVERPAEIWSIKSMVANVIKSKLVELPSAPPPSATETPNGDGASARLNHQNDPWRNVFPKPRSGGFHHRQPQFYPPPPENNEAGEGGWNVEDMGMYDAEDGGIYRCLECMHEIWGGVCTNCDREYPGHARFDDDDDGDFSEDGSDGEHFLGRRLREIWGGYVRDNPRMGWGPDDEDEDEGGGDGVWYGAYGDPMDLTDESISDEHSDLDNGEEDGFTSGSGDEDDESEHSWSSDEGNNHDNPLLDHQRDMVNMIHGDPHWPFGLRLRRQEPGVAHIEEVDDEEEDGDEDDVSHSDDDSHSHPDSVEDEEAYEDSFIDDEEEDGPQVYHLRNRNHNRRQRNRFEVLEVDDDDDEPPIDLDENDDDGVDHRAIARRLGRGMRMGAGTPPPPPPPIPGPERHRRRRENPIIVDDEDDNDHGVGSRVRRRGIGRAGRRRIVYEEPSEDDVDIVVDDEEEEVRPAGRRRGNARRRVQEFIVDEDSE